MSGTVILFAPYIGEFEQELLFERMMLQFGGKADSQLRFENKHEKLLIFLYIF